MQLASNSISYPNLGSYTTTELTRTFYDDYSWRSSYGNPLAGVMNNSYAAYFPAASNTTFPYPQSLTATNMLKGLVTGTRTKVLDTAQYLYTINFYDDRGRLIQVQSTNMTQGVDILTTQYSFNGQPLTTVQKTEKQGTNAQTTINVTRLTYDSLWRVALIEKKVSNSKVNGGGLPSVWTAVAVNEYDSLGQLKKKKLGNKGGGVPLANLDYQYNIRGWLLSINKGYIGSSTNNDQYFGMELGYDKNASFGTFLPKYNGNISGTIWKSEGDQQKRKYDFSYDAVNRLKAADFNQYESGTGASAVFGRTAGIDFSVRGLNYDANGNILSMVQKGLKVTTSETLDSLLYTYMPNSNKLKNVLDRANDTATKLGDFRSSKAYMTALSNNKTTAATDYFYDGNGNMIKDLNKDIDDATYTGIEYNHLNLPSRIRVKNKGTIEYRYDATGNKLLKIVKETGKPDKRTLYLGGSVFENDSLQFISHEEGRIRFTAAIGATPSRLDYDYYIKDHLGNVRMVLTEQRQQDVYPAATLEGFLADPTSEVGIESQYYTINSSNIVYKVSGNRHNGLSEQ